MQFQFRPDDDDRAAGIIHALAEQILAETSALALEHVAQRFQRAVARAGDRTAVAAVVEQRVHRFLQHAFFVADDDFRRLELEQRLETVVPVDDAAIKIVQIGRRKTSAFERHERAQIRRNHRQHRENHPFGTALGNAKALEQLDPLRQFFADLLALRFGHRLLQMIGLFHQIHLLPAPRARLPRPSWRRTHPRRRSRAPRGTRVRSTIDFASTACCPDQSRGNPRNKSRAPDAAPSCPAPGRCARACT